MLAHSCYSVHVKINIIPRFTQNSASLSRKLCNRQNVKHLRIAFYLFHVGGKILFSINRIKKVRPRPNANLNAKRTKKEPLGMTRPSIYDTVYMWQVCGQPRVLCTYHMDDIHVPHATSIRHMYRSDMMTCLYVLHATMDMNVARKLFYLPHIHSSNKHSIWNKQRKASGRLERRSSCGKAHWVRTKTGNNKFREQKGKRNGVLLSALSRCIFRCPKNNKSVASEVTHISSWFILKQLFSSRRIA